MIRHFGLTSAYPFPQVLGDILHYALILVGGLLVLYKLREKLISSGHDENKLTSFLLVSIALGIPAAFLGSAAAAMLYHPPGRWSLDLLLGNISSGKIHTFHAGIILPIIILSILTPIMRYRYLEVMDTVFLYVPVAHAIGRVGCLIVGCCWGRSVTLDIPGLHGRFLNPIPLYSILLNICIFHFLKRLYDKTYLNQATTRRYEGSIVASYLVSYGVMRIILEVFRAETRIMFALTEAQIAMIFFMVIGLAIFAIIQYRGRHGAASKGIDAGVEDATNRLFSLLGVVVSYLALLFVMYHLSRRLRIVQWPIDRPDSISDAYSKVVSYLPAFLLPLVAVYWLRRIDFPILRRFKWRRFSRVFYIGLIVSAFPALDSLVFGELRLRGLDHWLPFLILCAINACCEEVVHRLAVFSLFKSAGYSNFVSVSMQALLYSVVHFMVISPATGALSFLYGCILGILMDRTDSVTPCIICHFIVDVGVLAPLLSY